MINPNKAYHLDHDCWSHTMLEVYRESPARAAAIYVHRTLDWDPPTPAMVLGSLTHALLFEPETFEERFTICDAKKRAGKKWTECCEKAEDMDCEPAMEYQAALANSIANSINSHDAAVKLLKLPGLAEKPIRWRDTETGLKCKCKPDWLLPNICVDLKTASDPRPDAFLKTVINYGYHRAAAHYLDGIATQGRLDVQWIWIVGGSKPPHDVWLYRMDDDLLSLGCYENEQAREELAESIKTGDWTAPGQSDLITLNRPKWARS